MLCATRDPLEQAALILGAEGTSACATQEKILASWEIEASPVAWLSGCPKPSGW
jgi:hypothetical protein